MDLIERKKVLLKDVIFDFDKFCREHDLDYFISFGTLLGAVRHGGFIPWDDDIDVSMHIDDCVKLQKMWRKYGNKEKYFLQNKKTDPYSPHSFWRLRVNGTTGIEKDHINVPMHWGIPLDIFPIYNAPKNKALLKLFQFSYNRSIHYSQYSYNHVSDSQIKHKIYYFATRFFQNLLYIINRLSANSGKIYHTFSGNYTNASKIRNKKDFYPLKDISFEGLTLRAPANTHNYLRFEYGEDYMTPPPANKRDGHITAIIDLDKDYTEYQK